MNRHKIPLHFEAPLAAVNHMKALRALGHEKAAAAHGTSLSLPPALSLALSLSHTHTHTHPHTHTPPLPALRCALDVRGARD